MRIRLIEICANKQKLEAEIIASGGEWNSWSFWVESEGKWNLNKTSSNNETSQIKSNIKEKLSCKLKKFPWNYFQAPIKKDPRWAEDKTVDSNYRVRTESLDAKRAMNFN